MIAPMDNSNINELLKLYYDEWKYRDEKSWKKRLQFFIAISFISTLSVSYQTFGSISLPNSVLFLFPIVGIILSFTFLWYCLSEAYRTKAIAFRIEKMIKDNFPLEYSKYGLVPIRRKNLDKNKKVHKIFEEPMAIWIPMLLFILELALSIAVIIFISQGYLTKPEI